MLTERERGRAEKENQITIDLSRIDSMARKFVPGKKSLFPCAYVNRSDASLRRAKATHRIPGGDDDNAMQMRTKIAHLNKVFAGLPGVNEDERK